MGVVTWLSLIIASVLQVRILQFGEVPVTRLVSGWISDWSLGDNVLHDACVHLTQPLDGLALLLEKILSLFFHCLIILPDMITANLLQKCKRT